MTRKEKAGNMMADSLIEWAHMMYNHKTAQGVIASVIERLARRLDEYIPVTEPGHSLDRPGDAAFDRLDNNIKIQESIRVAQE